MTDSSKATGWPRRYGRYLVFEEFARGGMASVHLGRLVADRGFSRLVAVKMLSSDRAASSFYARALEDEARIASRVRHPNVVQPLDVVAERGDVLYVMEYVHGVPLSHLLDEARKKDDRVPEDVTISVMLDVLSALHAAHEAKDETGRPLGVVHRDVSPQNVLVGLDGLARLADFGVAKAMRREERTVTGAVKGKPSYMSPEQQRGLPLSRQADVYAAGVVLAVSLTGARQAPDDGELADAWLRDMIESIGDRALRDVVVTATKPQARDRYATAAEMAGALATCPRATAEAVGACVQDLAGDVLEQRGELARRVESADAGSDAPPPLADEKPVAKSSSESAAKADANAVAEMTLPLGTLALGTLPVGTLPIGTLPVGKRLPSPPPVGTLPLRGTSSRPPPPAVTLPLPPAPASEPPPARSRPRSILSPGFLLVFCASLVVGALLVRNATTHAEPAVVPDRQPPPPNGIASLSPAPTPAPSPAASLAPAAPSPSVAPAAPSPSVAPAAPLVSAAASASPPSAPARGRAPAARSRSNPPPEERSPSPPPTSSPAVDCDPPFSIDAQGRKHYKPQCAQ